ncbi:MAG: ATP-binding protein [bacterium]|nr:ATP-binding protein [bacterium]
MKILQIILPIMENFVMIGRIILDQRAICCFIRTMFIGRNKEIESLNKIIDTEQATIGVLFGRRRIGKSELIRKAFENKNVLFFEGAENRSKEEQIENFIFQLSYQVKKEYSTKKIKTWREAFILLYEEVQTAPAHIVLDEFQWMANYRHEIVTDLKMVWDLYMSRLPGSTLILCGSIASFMTTKVIKSTALYGRTDLVIHLKEFLLPETKELLAGKGILEVLEAQMLFGGVPKYLNLVRLKPSIRIGMEELAFTETGYFTNEYDRIFLSHFGKNPEYERIVRVLAEHPYGLFRKQIAGYAEVDQGSGLTTHLRNLESAGFISSTTPFHKGYNSKLLKYYLSDPYLRFYFSFIQPNLKKIKSGIYEGLFAKISQSGAFSVWMGRSFEYLCIHHAGIICKILGFSGIEFSYGPYYSSPAKDRSGVQIDLLFDRKDNVITLCEMKYSLAPVGISIIEEVERKVNILQEKFGNKTIQKVLITPAGATNDLNGSGYFYRVIDPVEFLVR